jgi:hypothetical protein
MKININLVFVLLTSKHIGSVKIVKFTNNSKDGTGARIINVKPQDISDFTMCIDFVVTLIKDFRLLITIGTNDIEILIPNSLDNIQVQFKGIW